VAQVNALDNTMAKNGVMRWRANAETIQHFLADFGRDNLTGELQLASHVWYAFVVNLFIYLFNLFIYLFIYLSIYLFIYVNYF
jgi:hypothetical protein